MKMLLKYLQNRETALVSILKIPRQEYERETFHKLRLEIKKLNALFKMAGFCKKDFKYKKTFKPFKKIFRQAGRVRELQVEAEMLNSYMPSGLLNDYRTRIKEQCLTEQEVFFGMVDKALINLLNKKFKKANRYFREITAKEIARYIAQLKKNIEKIYDSGDFRIQTLHKLRKKLKEMIYVTRGLIRDDKNAPPSDDYIFTQLAGEWHDGEVITEHLQNIINEGGITEAEEQHMEKVISKISSYNKSLLKKIRLTPLATA